MYIITVLLGSFIKGGLALPFLPQGRDIAPCSTASANYVLLLLSFCEGNTELFQDVVGNVFDCIWLIDIFGNEKAPKTVLRNSGVIKHTLNLKFDPFVMNKSNEFSLCF